MNNVFRIQALMTLGDFISGPIESIRRSFQACAKDSEGLAGRIEALGKRFAPFAVVAGLVIGGMTATALATAETSEALGELATLGTNDLEMFRAKAMQVSNEWAGVTTPNFIKSAYAVTSAFSDLSEQAQADITEMASIASVATKASAEDMTEFIGKAYNIMGKSAEFKGLSEVQKVEQIFAGMSGSVREFMTTGPAMKQSLMAMGNSATLAGLGISDQLSALGLLSNMMEASVAGTGFKTFVNKLPQVSKELGLNFKDASGQMLPLADIIETITRKVGGLSSNASQIKVISLFGEEGANAFKSLSDNSEKLRNKTAAVGGAMKTGREYVIAMAKAANDNLGTNIKKTNQQISNTIQVIGALFVPIVSVAIQFISWLALGFQKVAGVIAGNPILKWIVQMMAILVLAASFAGMFGALITFLPGIIALVGGYAASMWTAATATLAATWPIYALIAVIGLLVLAYKTNFLGIGDTLRGWYNTVKLVVEGVRAVFANLKGRDFTITGDLADKLRAGGLVGIVTVIAGSLFRLWQILRGVGDVAKAVGQILGPVFSGILWVFASAIGGVISILRDLWGMISMIISPIIKLIGLINPDVWRVLGIMIGLFAAGLGAVFAILAAAPFASVIGFFSLAAGAVWGLIKVIQLLTMSYRLVLEYVIDGFVMLGNLNWGTIFGAIGRSIITEISKTYNFITGGIQTVINFLSSINLFESGRALWQTFINGIKSMASDTVNTVKSVFGRIANFFPHSDAKEGPLSTLTLSGNRLLSTFAEGVNRGVPALRKSVGVALTGLMPLTSGADVSAPAMPRPEPVVVTAPAPVVRQETPVMKPAAPVMVPASPVITAPPAPVTPAPVVITAPAVSVANPAPVHLAAPMVTQAPPVATEPQNIRVSAAEVTVAGPVIEQVPPVMPAAQTITAPAPEIIPAARVVIPGSQVEAAAPLVTQARPIVPAAQTVTAPAPEIAPAGSVTIPGGQIQTSAPTVTPAAPISLAAPTVTQAQPVIPAPPVIRIEAAAVTVVGSVIEQVPPVMPTAQTITAPAPEIVPAAPVTAPAARVEMAAPGVVTPAPVMVDAPAVSVVGAAPVEMAAPEMATPPAAEAPAFGSTPLPEPVSRETVRETTQETVRVERAQAPAGESRRYTITIQNLSLPNVTDVRSFAEELSGMIDGYDGGKG